MHGRTIAIWSGVSLGVLVLIFSFFLLMSPAPEHIQGEVEATEIDVASKIPGRIKSVLVREGDRVTKGQDLALIDSPEIQAKLEQAKAAQAAAVAQRDKAEAGARDEEINAARDMWQRAKAASDLADKTYQRINRLVKQGHMPIQKLDEAKTNLKAARDAADAAHETYKLALAGAREEDKQTAQALADQAGAVISEVEAAIAETRLQAPISGEVSQSIVDPGEIVNAGYPIITIVDLEDIWVTFNVREDKLQSLKIGDSFTAAFPALSGRELTLEVTYISPLGDFATWRATNVTGEFDLKTFEVRARPTEAAEGLRPGMSAIAPWPPQK